MELDGNTKLEIANNKASTKKIILKLAWPVIAEQSLATITQIVDMIMVGRLGAGAVTAIGLTVQPLLFAQAMGAAMSVGTTALVARFIGGNNKDEAGRVLQQSLLVSFFISLLSALFFYQYAERIMIFMGAEPVVTAAGASYFRLMVPGFVFMFLGFIVTAALRGAGDTKTSLRVNILVNLVNIIGNYVLIFGRFGFPELGLDGAAAATSISRSLGGLILLVIIFRKSGAVTVLRQGFFRLDLKLIKRIMWVGIPTAVEQFIFRIAQLLFVREVASLGTTAYAAHQLAINAESLSYMPGFGIAVAATTLVGQNLGAGLPEQAEESTYQAWKLGSLMMGGMALIFLLFPEFLIRLYQNDPEIIRLGARNLRIIAFAQIPMGTQFIFAGALRGAGDTRPVLYSTALSSWLVRYGLAYLMINVWHLGLAGAWLAMNIDWIVRGTFVVIRFRQGSWKTIRI